jgi:LysW-gamma-L-lysine/LysW-L-ornithine aminotransferase
VGDRLSTVRSPLLPIPLHADRGISLVRGEGSYLWDSNGRRYLDLMTNYGVNILGHSHPRVVDAITRQARELTNAHQSFDSPARAEFLSTLAGLLPPELARVSFANSGAESIEAAIKYVRAATGRAGIVATHRAYHGRTYGALAATSDAKYRDPYAPMLSGFQHVPYDDPPALEEAVNESTAAVILEPIQGEGGVRIPSDAYLARAAGICRAAGALLVLDEVQTGFRTGSVLAFFQSGVTPDVVCISKGLANGLPIGVTAVTEDVSDRIPKGSHGSTFAGNPLVCAAATATLQVAGSDECQSNVRRVSAYFLQALAGLELPDVRDVRGRGLMLALELKRPATPVIKSLQGQGILALPGGATVVRFLPSLLLQEDEVDVAVQAVGKAVVETR